MSPTWPSKVPALQPPTRLLPRGLEIAVLIDAFRVMGRSKTNASVMRELPSRGYTDDSDTSYAGYNLINGILLAGEFANQIPFDFYFLAASFRSPRAHSIPWVHSGVSIDGFFKDSRVAIGGSPARGNVFEDVGWD